MKKLSLLIGLISLQTHADDLVFKNSFENSSLVTGTVSGLVSSGLQLELSANNTIELLSISSNGAFTFHLYVAVGDFWSVSIASLPSNPQQQNCGLTNSSGNMPINGANILLVSCDNITGNWNQMNWDQADWN